MNRKKVFALILMLAMLLALAGCGESGEQDPNAGLYEAQSAQMYGLTLQISDVFEEGFSLELKNGGKAVFHYDGKDYNLKWMLDGDVFHAEGGGAALDGTLSNGVMQLQEVLGREIEITLVCSELTETGS